MCLADPSNSPRPKRAIELCVSLGFHVSVLCYTPNTKIDAVQIFPVISPSYSLLQRVLRKIYGAATAVTPTEKGKRFWENLRFGIQGVINKLGDTRFAVIIVENLELLPLAFSLTKKNGFSRVIFDAREYYPLEFEGNIWFELFEKKRRISLCSQYLSRCDIILTVSEGLKKKYASEFGINPVVYLSTPYYVEQVIHKTHPDQIKLVYHGAANRDRKLENLIEVLLNLEDRFSLDMILMGNPQYQAELKKKAAGSKRIAFPAPVHFEEIIPTIGKYDIGFFYYEPNGFNVTHCMPNKFFEYIQARLMLAVGPSPDMAELVNYYNCGVIAKDFSVKSMVLALNALSVAEIDAAKANSDRAARELCFEKEREKLAAVLVDFCVADNLDSLRNAVYDLSEGDLA